MKKGGGSESTIIVGPSKSVRVYALHSLEYVLGLDRFQVFVPKLLYIYIYIIILSLQSAVEKEALASHTDVRGFELLLTTLRKY